MTGPRVIDNGVLDVVLVKSLARGSGLRKRDRDGNGKENRYKKE